MACGRIGQGGKQAIPFSGLVPSYLGFYFDLIRYKDSLLGMTKVQSQTYHSWSKTVPLTAPIRYLENIQFQLGLKEEPMINSHLQKASLPNRKGEKWTMNWGKARNEPWPGQEIFPMGFKDVQQCFHCTFLKEQLPMHIQFQIQKLRSQFDNCTF